MRWDNPYIHIVLRAPFIIIWGFIFMALGKRMPHWFYGLGYLSALLVHRLLGLPYRPAKHRRDRW